jgi:hypothetical protein
MNTLNEKMREVKKGLAPTYGYKNTSVTALGTIGFVIHIYDTQATEKDVEIETRKVLKDTGETREWFLDFYVSKEKRPIKWPSDGFSKHDGCRYRY